MSVSEEVTLEIPPQLKSRMEDDCFWIIRRKKLVKLPKKPSVETLLLDYYTHCAAAANEETNLPLLAEVLDGVKIYFDFMLRDHLLYEQEREQYDRLLGSLQLRAQDQVQAQQKLKQDPPPHQENDVTDTPLVQEEDSGSGGHDGVASPKAEMPSSVYGIEHLLRLFVKLPLFLSKAQLPSGQVNLLHTHFKEFLSYVNSKTQEILSEDNYVDVAT